MLSPKSRSSKSPGSWKITWTTAYGDLAADVLSSELLRKTIKNGLCVAKLRMTVRLESHWLSSFGGVFEFAGAQIQGSDAYLLIVQSPVIVLPECQMNHGTLEGYGPMQEHESVDKGCKMRLRMAFDASWAKEHARKPCALTQGWLGGSLQQRGFQTWVTSTSNLHPAMIR